jgi:ankyrin repeat protein
MSADSYDIEDFIEAVTENNIPLVNELLLYDPNIFLSKEGKLALHIASSKNLLCIVNILIANIEDDNINAVDQNGSTALHASAEEGNLNIMNCLLNNGSNINAQDNDGYSAFHLACYHGHLQIVNILIDRGMHVNIKDNDGFTAYHVACLNGHMEVVKNLIDRGVVPLLMKKEKIYPKIEKPLLYKAVFKKKKPKLRSPKLKKDNALEYYDIEGLDDVYIYSWEAMGVYDDDDLCNVSS